MGSIFLFTDHRAADAPFSAGWSLVMGSTRVTTFEPPLSVSAIHLSGSGPDYPLNFAPSPRFPNMYAMRTPYLGQTGQWTIAAADGSPNGAAANTHTLSEPRMLPILDGLAASGPALTPHVTWSAIENTANFPSFCSNEECAPGFDFFNYQVEVRLPGGHLPLVYLSPSLPTLDNEGNPAPTSFDIPAGVLSAGTDYLIGLRFNHADAEIFDIENQVFVVPVENRSTAFVAYTAAIPEPGTYALLAAGLGLLGFVARRRRAS